MSRSVHTFLPKSKQVAGMAIGALAMLAMATPALTQEPSPDEVFSLNTIIGVTNTGIGNLTNHSPTLFSFDISWFNFGNSTFYLADRSNKSIDIFDTKTGTFTQKVNPGFQGFTGNNDTSGPDGVLDANNHTEIWVGDTGGTCFPDPNPLCGPGQVWVLNLDGSVKNIGVPNPIPVGGKTRADEMCIDLNHGLIMLASPAEDPPFVTFLNTTTYKVVGQLKFDGGNNTPKATNGLEQCGWSPLTGLFYQNVPEIDGPGNDTQPGGVSVIDPASVLSGAPTVMKTVTIPLANCAGPQGMAIGGNTSFGGNTILEGCNARGPDGHRNTVILDTNTLAVLQTFADLGGADEVWFNPGDGHFIVPSCNTACRTLNGGGFEVLAFIDALLSGAPLDQSVTVASQTPPVNPAASGNPRTIHSVAAASNTNQVFLPIPAVGGAAPQFGSSLCDQTGGAGVKVIGTTPVSSATGCIVILTTPAANNDAGLP
jgi:hypothetical protein